MSFTMCPVRRVQVQNSVAYSAGRVLTRPPRQCWGFWLVLPLLVLSSGPAYAAWVFVSGDDEAEMAVYVDPDTIRRHGDLVKRWHLSDRKTVGGYGSIKAQREYDCAHQFNKVGTDAVRHENQRISTDNRNNGCLQRPEDISPAVF